MSAIVSENPTINEQKNKATFPGDQKASGATLEGTGGFALPSHGRADQFLNYQASPSSSYRSFRNSATSSMFQQKSKLEL
jgi:hypothetical protein